MERREKIWAAASAVLAAALIYQSIALMRAEARLAEAADEPYWPNRLQPIKIGPADGKFVPSTSTTIPAAFWGEFAEDVHDCSGERSMLLKNNEIVMPGEVRLTIETVRWKQPLVLQVDARDKFYASSRFGMQMSEDRNEITFVYTNLKRVVQRCSTRSHESMEIDTPTASGTLNTMSDAVTAEDETGTENVIANVEGSD